MAGFTPTRLAAATAAVTLLVSPLLPTSLSASAHGHPTASLSYLFRDNGAHFSVKAWETTMAQVGLGVSANKIKSLKAEWKRVGPKQKTALNDWVNRVTLGPVFPPFKDALAVCKRFYGKSKHWKSYCAHWWGSHAIEITGWQYMPYGEDNPAAWASYHGQMAKGGSIEVYAMPYFTKLPADRGGNMQNMVFDHGAIQLPVDFPQANRAWLAPDSPLPLIAFYNEVKNAPLNGTGGRNSPSTHQVMTAGQLEEFWGWIAPVVMAPQVWRFMKAAGFNPIQAGGPNVPPGTKPPAWSSIFWNVPLASKSGWAHPYMPSTPWGPNNTPPGFAGT